MNVSASKIQNKLNKRKLCSVKYYACTYLIVHDYGGTNRRNNDAGLNRPTDIIFMTCNAKTKKMMTIKITTDRMHMHCIN